MKHPLILCSLIVALPFLGFADESEEGFVSLFNGKDLTDWESVEGAWAVEDGAIVCTGKHKTKNWIIWRGGETKDFELRLEFQYVSGNSGVQVRSKELPEFMVQGYQVEVAAQNKMGLWHHSLSPEPYRSHLATAGQKGVITADGTKTQEQVDPAEEVQKAFKEGEWNEMTIIAKGSTLTQKVNGVTLAVLVDEDAKYAMASGVLAFQDHGKGTVAKFRNVRLKTL